MHQNTPSLSLPLRNGIWSQTKEQKQEMYWEIKVHVTQMLWKWLEWEARNADERLIDRADETQAHAKKLLREEQEEKHEEKKKWEIS